MSAIDVNAQDLLTIDTNAQCVIAIFSLLVYDWLLCFSQEVRLIWTWRSRRVTVASLVYIFSRYTWLIESLLSVATIYPMSDLRYYPEIMSWANVWIQSVTGTMDLIAISTFSALRAYALSNRSTWLAAVIIFSALPPAAMYFFTAELFVVGITWYYTYQSYRIRKGINLGKTVSSLLFYNGSGYFLCLATLYLVDIILNTASQVPVEVLQAAQYLDQFMDPVVSILTCHFMLSLRQFDNTIADTAGSGLGSQLREHMSLNVLQFGAHPSDSLPAVVTPFAHPVHVDSDLFEMDPDATDVDSGTEERDIEAVASAPDGPFRFNWTPEPTSQSYE
ncbi:hypothetical protein V8D89_002962 [Ganoderma adspersum]